MRRKEEEGEEAGEGGEGEEGKARGEGEDDSNRRTSACIMAWNLLQVCMDSPECNCNFAQHASTLFAVRAPHIKAKHHLLGRRRWHFRSPRLYTSHCIKTIAIIHPLCGIRLQLCTIWLKAYCRAVLTYQKNSLSSRPPTMVLWFTAPPCASLHEHFDDIRGVRLQMLRVLLLTL